MSLDLCSFTQPAVEAIAMDSVLQSYLLQGWAQVPRPGEGRALPLVDLRP